MTLRDRLRHARHARFVGRKEECDAFKAALAAEALPFQVLYLHGPGGIGKSALLGEFAYHAEEAGLPVTTLDARELGEGEEALAAEVARRLGVHDGRQVLIVDTVEAAPRLQGLLRTRLLLDLPEETLVVLASRQPPEPAWRGDVGWRGLLHPVPLRNLPPADSRAMLAAQGIPADQHDPVVRLTHGHPLALALVVDRYQHATAVPEDLADAPDVASALLTRFVEETASGVARTALEAAALLRTVTEDALGILLEDEAEAARAFEWLQGLSFVEPAAEGLRLHDLARDVIGADLHWRRPERHAELEARARRYYTGKLLATRSETKQQQILADYASLHRHNPIVQPMLHELQARWRAVHPESAGPPLPHEHPALTAMVERHEGAASAAIAARWLTAQSTRVHVFRDEGGEPEGFLMCLALHATTAEERRVDPSAEAAWAYLARHAPLRPGERATLFRFWMDREAHQRVSAVQSLIFVATVRHYLEPEGPAYTFLPCADPHYWGPVLTFAGMTRLREARFEVGGAHYGVYGHDWRTVPPGRWLERIASRGLPELEPPVTGEEIVVLSEPDFKEAVRGALRDFARPHEMEKSPLLAARFVLRRGGDRLTALRAAIEEAAEQLRATPREEPYYLALDATYLDPARTQAEAAEQLDLAFSTYRRYLKRAMEHVVEALWQEELAA